MPHTFVIVFNVPIGVVNFRNTSTVD